MKIIKSLTNCYNKLSNFGKILIFIALLLVLVIFFKSIEKTREGMDTFSDSYDVNNEVSKFLFKQGTAIYDDFYADIYDYLVFNNIKNDYEVGIIVNSTVPSEKSVIADIGCGTGHQVNDLKAKNLEVVGVDISPSMVKKAQSNYPDYAKNFMVGDGLDGSLFRDNSLTHILCLYFTI